MRAAAAWAFVMSASLAPPAWAAAERAASCAARAQLESQAPETTPLPADADPAELVAAGWRDWQAGRAREAARSWRAARELQRRGGDRAAELDTLARLARADVAQGFPGRAQQSLEEALVLARAEGDPARVARLDGQLASVEAELGLTERAHAHVEQALAAARAAGAERVVAELLNVRAGLRATAGETDAALADYEDAAGRAQAAGADALAAELWLNRARLGAENGRPEVARGSLEAARAGTEALAPSSEAARRWLHAGRSWAALARADEPEAATRARTEAAGAFLRALALAEQAGDARTRSYAEGWLAEVYFAEARRGEAAELTRRALFSAQQADAPDALWRWQAQLGRLLRAEGDVDGALERYRAALETWTSLGPEVARAAGGPATRRGVESLHTELTDLLLERAAFTEDRPARERLLREARDAQEDLKAAELRDYFRDECLAAQRSVSAEALPGTVVLYPVALDDRMELLVSRPGEIRAIRVPGAGREALATEVLAFRRLLEKRTTRQFLAPSQRLYDLLVRPLEPLLAGAKVLVVVPGGPLRTIPFAALHDRESGKFLIEKIPLAITPGLRLTEPRPLDRARVRLLKAGLSEAVQGFPPLPNVEREIAALDRAFGGTTLLNAEFVTPAVERALGAQSFGIVHIASHGEFHEDAARSFLLTWDNRLALGRLADLVGATRFREQPLELLALSACETAAGDERAALGLAGVAVRAGARSALATLWSIPDESSAELVGGFYAKLAQPTVSRAEALRSAQIEVLARPEFRHPFYWAPFLLISNWL